MARKTTEICKKMIAYHNNASTAIFNNLTLPPEQKIVNLNSLNLFLENLLEESKCYHGYNFVCTGKSLEKTMLNSILEESYREYCVK